MTGSRRRVSSLSRPMGGYSIPAAEVAPAADWIGYRHSLANVWRRHARGDTAARCPACKTETDVPDVIHSPRCKA